MADHEWGLSVYLGELLSDTGALSSELLDLSALLVVIVTETLR